MAEEKRLTLLTGVRVASISAHTAELEPAPHDDAPEDTASAPAARQTIPNDFVFALIGQTADPELFRTLGVALNGGGLPDYDEETAETPVPGLYIAGALSRANIILESRRRAVEIVARIAGSR